MVRRVTLYKQFISSNGSNAVTDTDTDVDTDTDTDTECAANKTRQVMGGVGWEVLLSYPDALPNSVLPLHRIVPIFL